MLISSLWSPLGLKKKYISVFLYLLSWTSLTDVKVVEIPLTNGVCDLRQTPQVQTSSLVHRNFLHLHFRPRHFSLSLRFLSTFVIFWLSSKTAFESSIKRVSYLPLIIISFLLCFIVIHTGTHFCQLGKQIGQINKVYTEFAWPNSPD